VLELDPSVSDMRGLLGQAYLRKGRNEDAIRNSKSRPPCRIRPGYVRRWGMHTRWWVGPPRHARC
jgi:hypothetical protein